MRHALRSSTVHSRAIVAAALALGLTLVIVASAWAALSVTIESGPDDPTRDRTPEFVFTPDPGARDVDCSLDQGTPDFADCTSPYTAAPLEDGTWTFRVRVAADGEEDQFAERTFTVDTTPPEVSIGAGQSGPANDPTPEFAFAVDGSATTVECSVDQEPAEPCVSPYAVAGPLSEGIHTFSVHASDALGNESSDVLAFTIDTVRPRIDVTSGPSGPTNIRAPTFGFTAEAGADVECSIDRGTPDYGDCSTASTHTAGALTDGSYTFRVQATDAAGNRAEDSRSFDLDTERPTVSVDSGPTITRIRTPTFEFTVTGATSFQCSIDRGTPSYGDCTTGSSHTAAALADGSYTFRVLARDAAGNQMGDAWRFTIDSAAPGLSIDSGPRGDTNDTTPSFGFAAEVGTTTECLIDMGTPAPCTSPYTASALSEGSHTFRVWATDSVGNEAAAERSFTIDTTPPSLSIDSGPTGTTSDSTPVFGFLAEAGAALACSIDQGAPAYGACTGGSAHAAVTPLADGAYTFRVRATDRAGNATTVERAFAVDAVPDTPSPTPPAPPTPPTTTTPPPAAPQLLSPFPLVRISGALTRTGARIRLLTVRASAGTLVRVTVTPACARGRRSSRRCRVVQASGTVGRRAVIAFRGLARAYRGGTVIVVRAWRADRIGKYTRFTIVRGKAPRRVDQCLMPGASRGSRCPSD